MTIQATEKDLLRKNVKGEASLAEYLDKRAHFRTKLISRRYMPDLMAWEFEVAIDLKPDGFDRVGQSGAKGVELPSLSEITNPPAEELRDDVKGFY